MISNPSASPAPAITEYEGLVERSDAVTASVWVRYNRSASGRMDSWSSVDDSLRYATPIGRPSRLLERAVAIIPVYTDSWLDRSVSNVSEWMSLGDTPFDAV